MLESELGKLGQTRSQKRKFEKETAMEGSEIIFEDENIKLEGVELLETTNKDNDNE